ncbi:MAG: enoyl-CoA hydratase-related protein [Actinomycetota bacterium]|nr:enoyl-CoA hydratase-related protein [Actinomycetota bacterium]
MTTLERHGDVFILDLGDGENRFHPDWIAAVNSHLDEVTKADSPAALVTTATGKFFSNGLDLDWLGGSGADFGDYVADVHALFARVLALPVITVAALQGHTFAAGAMLSLAHDFRVMRADRGFFCFPEVDIRIPFTPGMAALIQAKLTPAAQMASMTTGRRFGGTDAAAIGIVDGTAGEGAVTPAAVELLRPLAGKDPGTLGAIKTGMFGPAVAALTAT